MVADLLKEKEVSPPSTDLHISTFVDLFKKEALDVSIAKSLVTPDSLSAGDGMLVVASARMRRKRMCGYEEKSIYKCECDRYYSQLACDIGWDSSRNRFYHGYDQYMLVASGSESDLPVFPMLGSTSRHDSHGFCTRTLP